MLVLSSSWNRLLGSWCLLSWSINCTTQMFLTVFTRPAAGPYSEPDESSSYPLTLLYTLLASTFPLEGLRLDCCVPTASVWPLGLGFYEQNKLRSLSFSILQPSITYIFLDSNILSTLFSNAPRTLIFHRVRPSSKPIQYKTIVLLFYLHFLVGG
jgi:hypothetical protein